MLMKGLALCGLFAGTMGQGELLVKTDKGMVQGHYNGAGIREWNGIPYARPPLGSLRWEYPQDPDEFPSTYEANYLAPACAQDCKLPPGNCPDLSGVSEDCLYLSVMAPATPSQDSNGYPVFFWIHGGAYEQGMGNAALYNGTNFAQKDVITVVINYRLGAMGFLAAEVMSGNYGHMDQRKALEWVQSNIAAFGGNPNAVTVGGQSAGAMSTAAHLISPGSAGLFQQAIMESNPLGLPFHERDSATTNANDVFTYLNCAINDIECMRTKSMDEILDAQAHAVKLNFDNLFINFLPFAPLVEPTGEIPEQPFYGLMNGHWPRMPMLQGSVRDEGLMFVDELFTKPINEPAYKAIIGAVFGLKYAPEILQAYPMDYIPGSSDAREVMNVLSTDLLFYCPLRNVTRAYQANTPPDMDTNLPTYEYKFNHVISFDCWGEGYEFCVDEICHGSELCFVFNVYGDGINITYTPTPDEVQLTTDISNAWSNFITHGNPNKGLEIKGVYPQLHAKSDTVIVLDEPDTELVSHQREKYCDMWDRMGYFY